MQGRGFPAGNPSATTVNVVLHDHRFGSDTVLSVPCSVLSVAASGRSLQCVLSRPNYEHTPYFNILLYGVPDAAVSNPTSRRLLAGGSVADTTSVEDQSEVEGRVAGAVVRTMTEDSPTVQPTYLHPSGQPTRLPSGQPSMRPASQPTQQPSNQPTQQPTRRPFSEPSSQPTLQPSTQPSFMPSCPTGQPTYQPSGEPSR